MFQVDLAKDSMMSMKQSTGSGQSQMDKFVKEKEFLDWFETSAKDNLNIDEACKCLVTKILENDERMQVIKCILFAVYLY
jgi:hypothetical protein